MFRSLQMRLVLILVLLVTVVMVVVGAFLISSVTSYQIRDFQTQISQVFTPEFILQLEKNTGSDDAPATLRDMLSAYSGLLGVDSHRDFFVLDGKTGVVFEPNNAEVLSQVLISLLESPDQIRAMKRECLDRAKNFTPKLVMKDIIDWIAAGK